MENNRNVGAPASDRAALQAFNDQIKWLYEPEFGDFKRKAGLYIQRLEETHPQLAKGNGRAIFAKMKSVVMFNPNGDIEATRKELLQLTQQLMGLH